VAGHLAGVDSLATKDRRLDLGTNVHVAERTRRLLEVLPGVNDQQQHRRQREQQQRVPSSHGGEIPECSEREREKGAG
jgi:hypothetical protein